MSSMKTPAALDDVVARVGDRDLDVGPGVGAEIERPVLGVAAVAGRRPPVAGRAGRVAALAGAGLVVGQERMDVEPERADEPGVLGGVAVEVGEGRPVVLADRVDLDEHEVPRVLGVAVDPERQLGAAGGHADRARQALVRGVGRLRERELRAGPGSGDRLEEVGVDGVPVVDAVRRVRRRRRIRRR